MLDPFCLRNSVRRLLLYQTPGNGHCYPFWRFVQLGATKNRVLSRTRILENASRRIMAIIGAHFSGCAPGTACCFQRWSSLRSPCSTQVYYCKILVRSSPEWWWKAQEWSKHSRIRRRPYFENAKHICCKVEQRYMWVAVNKRSTR